MTGQPLPAVRRAKLGDSLGPGFGRCTNENSRTSVIGPAFEYSRVVPERNQTQTRARV
jgi:hypothetical protein